MRRLCRAGENDDVHGIRANISAEGNDQRSACLTLHLLRACFMSNIYSQVTAVELVFSKLEETLCVVREQQNYFRFIRLIYGWAFASACIYNADDLDSMIIL